MNEVIKINTRSNNVWYEVDEHNRIFRCFRPYGFYSGTHQRKLISSKNSQEKAIHLANQFAIEFNQGYYEAS